MVQVSTVLVTADDNPAALLLHSAKETTTAMAVIGGLATEGIGVGSQVYSNNRGGIRALLWRPQGRALFSGHKQR